MPTFAVPGNQPVRIETACGNCGELVHTTKVGATTNPMEQPHRLDACRHRPRSVR